MNAPPPVSARSPVSDRLDCADDRSERHRYRLGGAWRPIHPASPTNPASFYADACRRAADAELAARILTLADAVTACHAAMDDFIGGRRGSAAIALTYHPAFRELVADLAAKFTELTEAVDPLQEQNLPWEGLIADSRVLAGLKAGQRRWQEHCSRERARSDPPA